MTQSNGRTAMVQGRIVWIAGGDLFKGDIQKDFNTKQPKVNAAGEIVKQYGFGLAVPKAQLGELWQAIHEEAYTLFPNRMIPPSFAMKYKDGDGVDDKGQPFGQREGYAGHLVFACTTSLPIKFFKYENGQNIQVNEGIKCGDYINAQLNIKAHPAMGQGKAGLYLNPNAVQFLGYGTEIINRPSGDQIFGTQAPPQLGSQIPIAPQGQILPTAPAPQAYVPPPQAAPVPHYAVVPQHHQPQAAQVPNGYPAPVAAQPQTPTGYPPAATAQAAFPSSPAMPPGYGQPSPYPPAQNAGFPAVPGQR